MPGLALARAPMPPSPLQPPAEDPLVELVALALAALEEGGPEALEAFYGAHPGEAADIRRRMALLGEHGLRAADGGAAAVGAPVALGERLGDFRLLRPLGGGGMGVVWLAEQCSLGREVALKVVRPDQLVLPGARERFRRESETVARLQHPGIVPVYAVGEERGLPWFAMELVRGLSLSEAVHALAERDPRTLTGADLAALLPQADGEAASPLYDGPWPEVCARIAREVAEALEHARRRGIVHRDVKPSNVMVTRGGRVLLLDFGLSARDADPRLTRTGSAVGSLAYMPPEALRGPGAARADQDPRQDVYSLGATLYELLALEAPFPQRGQADLLRAIGQGAPPLRRAHPEVSWELATIVAVAMDLDPARRYPHAGAMARDLANALERRPIEARPPGPVLRARRWAERHPARAVLLAALVVGPSALLAREIQGRRVVESKNVELAQANADLGDALAETQEQRALAQASFQRALDAVDRMLLRVGEHRLAGEPRMEVVQRELVTDALDFYGWFLEQEGQQGLAHEVARVALAAGDMHGRLHELDEALGALDRAEALLRGLLAADPRDAPAVLSLAETHVRRATVLRLASRHADAVASARSAIALLEPLELAAGSETRDRLLASAHGELGAELELGGDGQAGLLALERSVALLRGLPQDGPEGEKVRFDLALKLGQRGTLRARLTDRAGSTPDKAELELALADHEEAAALLASLVAEGGGLPEPRFRLARALSEQVYVLSWLGPEERGMEAAREALSVQEALFADFPKVPDYGADVARSCVNLAAFHGRRRELDEGRAVLEQGLRAFEATLLLSPDDPKLRKDYGIALVNAAGLREAGGDIPSALEALERAEKELALALQRTPDDLQTRGTAWFIAYRQGSTLLALQRPGEALERARGLLAHGPGLSEIETYAVLAAKAVQAVPAEERGELLARAAEDLSALRADGSLPEQQWTESASLAALRALDGFEAALASANAR